MASSCLPAQRRNSGSNSSRRLKPDTHAAGVSLRRAAAACRGASRTVNAALYTNAVLSACIKEIPESASIYPCCVSGVIHVARVTPRVEVWGFC